MLVKLLKYDLKFGKNTFLSMAAGLILGSILLKMIEVEFIGRFGFAAFMLFLAIPCAVVSIVLVFQNYNKCLFGDQGYLMLTLPVKREKILLSQTIISLFWFNVMMAAGAVMIIIISGTNISTFSLEISVPEVQMFLILSNITALFAITILFLIISFANISIKGKRLPGLFSGLIGFLWTILEIKITGDFLHRIFGTHVLNYRIDDGKLIMTLAQNVARGFMSIDLVFFSGLIVFIVINFCLNVYLLKHKVDLK